MWIEMKQPLIDEQRQGMFDLLEDYQDVMAVAMNALVDTFGGFPLEKE